MAHTRNAINLLPHQETSFVTQFLTWALSIGRLLIIIVETLALATFFYRFSLDMRIVDLKDEIKQEGFIIENFANQEAVFRNIQNRLQIAKTYGNDNTTTTLFQNIIDLGRGRITFHNILVTGTSVTIEASAPSPENLAAFTAGLKQNPQIQEVTVDKVENKTSDSTIIVVMNATLKTNTTQKTTVQPTNL